MRRDPLRRGWSTVGASGKGINSGIPARGQMKGRLRRELKARDAAPRPNRCASCGSEDRVQPHRVGAIEQELLLCRDCLRRALESEKRAGGPDGRP